MIFKEEILAATIQPELSAKIKNKKLSRSFLYIALLTIFLAGIRLLIDIPKLKESFNAIDTNNIPAFTVTNGEVVLNDGKDFYKQEFDGGAIIVDLTDDKSKSTEYDNYITAFRVTKNKLEYKSPENNFAYDIPKDFSMTEDGYNEIVNGIKIFFISMLGASVLLAPLNVILYASAVSLAGFVANKMYKTNLTFSQVFALSLYAFTTPILLEFLTGIINPLPVDAISFLYVFLGAIFLNRQIKCIRISME